MRFWLVLLGTLPLLAVGSGAIAGTASLLQNGLIAAHGENGIALLDASTSATKLVPGTVEAGGALAWSPDGSRLAFESWSGDNDVSSVKADGSDRRVVLRNAWSPSWSPDGNQLAAIRIDGDPAFDSANLWTVDADGGNPRQLTSDVDGVSEAAWSPDGKWIAFVNDSGLSRVRSDGTGRSAIWKGEVAQYPTWSPDGKWIAFVGADGIYRVRTDGTELERLSSDVVATRMAWSPDGSSIAFDRILDSSPAMEIVVLDLSGKRAETMLRRGFAPTWSPDGKQLAFSAHTSGSVSVGGCGGHAGGDVWVMNADGTKPHRLAKGDYGSASWGAAAPGSTRAAPTG